MAEKEISKLIYRCKNCGDRFTEIIYNEAGRIRYNFCSVADDELIPDDNNVNKYRRHDCSDNTIGIGELIALED